MSFVHTQAVPFLSSDLRLAAMCAKSGMNEASCFARPKNDRSWDMLVGVGNSAMALYLLSYGRMPELLTIFPAKVISFPKFFK